MHLIPRSLFSGSMAIVIAGSAFAQKGPSATQREALANLWLVRSQTITEDLVKDATGFRPSGRALLWARLGQQWWREDPERARAWILKSIEIVEGVPNRENPAAEASGDLKEAMAALNRVEKSKVKETDTDKPDSLDGSGFSRTVPASLLAMDEYAVREAVSSITSLESRAQVRLVLLEGCLEKMRSLRQAGSSTRPGVSN